MSSDASRRRTGSEPFTPLDAVVRIWPSSSAASETVSDQFALRIGPVCVALHGEIDPGRWALDAGHHKFFSSTTRSAHVTLRIVWGPTRRPAGQPVFRAGPVASFYRDGGRWFICLGEDEHSELADRVLSLDASGANGQIAMDPDRLPDPATRYPLEYPLEDFLFRHLMAEHGALLVHACGVSWRGAGYLFVGSSGAGKSTTARLWRAAGATILNDDRVVLEAGQDGIRIHPTPWFGEYPEVAGETAPLRALYLLRQGAAVAFERLRPVAAAALVFAKSFPPLWDPERMERNLETLGRVCQDIPCGWLTVPADASAVEWVQAQGRGRR
jgi:hypothetical protein